MNPECDTLRRRLGSTLLHSTLSYRSFVLPAERVTFSIIIVIIIIVIMIVDILYTVGTLGSELTAVADDIVDSIPVRDFLNRN